MSSQHMVYTYKLVMRAIAIQVYGFPIRELWPDAKRRVIVHVEFCRPNFLFISNLYTEQHQVKLFQTT